MRKKRYPIIILLTSFFLISFSGNSYPWHDETHIAIAKATGYKKWYNATGADMAKLKAGRKERFNHYVNNSRETTVTPEIVLQQAEYYNEPTNILGHLYPSIINTFNATGFRLTSTLSALRQPNSIAIKMMCFLVTTPVIYRSLPFLKQ